MGRTIRWSTLVAAILVAGVAASYVVFRSGRAYERNQLCCDIPRGQNLVIALQEGIGFLRFPSQTGQDRWLVERVFRGVSDGYFVDVGSADGFVESNTWVLEQRGWMGICIDPFPTNMEERTCQMFRDVVGSEMGQIVSFVQAGPLGGVTDHLGRWKSTVEDLPVVELTTVTLEDILRRANAPPFIHAMSLDIEGAELEALRGFPFDRYTLGAIVVEHNHEEPKRTQIEALLSDHGYARARTWMQDDFYLPRAVLDAE